MKKLNEILKSLRIEKNLSLRELSRELNTWSTKNGFSISKISKSSISRWERGLSSPMNKNLLIYSGYFNIKLKDLTKFIDDDYNKAVLINDITSNLSTLTNNDLSFIKKLVNKLNNTL